MNHSWKNNTCTKCGITRTKKKARIIKCSLLVNSAGILAEKPVAKVVQLWSYGVHGINRPDCPDELFGKAA